MSLQDINTQPPRSPSTVLLATVIVASLALCGCSMKRIAVNAVGDALAEGGSAYAADDDLELVGAATPFGLKLIESLLAESPKHRGLLLAAVRGFTQYAYAWVEVPADALEDMDVAAAYAERSRARKLYLRARDYGLRGLEAAHPAFAKQLRHHATSALENVEAGDVPFLYWTAAAWGAAISLGKDEPALLAELPQMKALARRALELDESYESGAPHGLMISVAMTDPGSLPERISAARRHFDRAVELSRGAAAAPFVTYAEAVSIPRGDRREFEFLLAEAMRVDPSLAPGQRLANELFQRRARRLLARADHYFSD